MPKSASDDDNIHVIIGGRIFLPAPKGHLLATCEIFCHHTSRCSFGASHYDTSRNGGRTFPMKKLGKNLAGT